MSTASDLRRQYKEDPKRRTVANCDHVQGLYWYAAPVDERGWLCIDCGWSPGEDEGYSPEHDRSHIETKVGSVLFDLDAAGIIYVGSSSNGDGITGAVVDLCRARKVFDSVSIARFILEIEAGECHMKFWRERGESILEGRDNRNRCKCGRLSNCSRGNGDGTWTFLCSDPKCDPRGDVPW